MGTDTDARTGLHRRPDRQRGRGTVGRYSPWDDVGVRYPEWVVRVRELHGPREVMCFVRKVILIDPGESAAERRCSLAHAIGHIDLGHDTCEPESRHERRQEIEADVMASRRLIAFDQLADVYRWTDSPSEACQELDVDMDMLKIRGKHLDQHEVDGLCCVRARKNAGA